jgi:Rps23 Pro-64 3,4-dihydroxylase Tpa1-like proline 4-hydroxylase
MDECVRERFVVVDDFLPEEDCLSMRADIEAHFSNPARHKADTHQVWNYWHVPGSYTYLRTTPEKVIAREKVQAFVDELRTWTAVSLGLAGVTWPYLSLYVPGCVQGLHNDSTNGRLGFVYSLTRNERKTIGGETVLVHDRDLFRTLLDRPAAGASLFDLVEPRFNRLTLFDDRIPHAVQRVDGSMDPLEGRFVLHGHISEAGVVVQGAVSPDVIQDQTVELLKEMRSGIAQGAQGPLVFSVEIAPTGEVEQVRPILDRLATGGEADLDAIRTAAADRIRKLRFPKADSPTLANIPLIF